MSYCTLYPCDAEQAVALADDLNDLGAGEEPVEDRRGGRTRLCGRSAQWSHAAVTDKWRA